LHNSYHSTGLKPTFYPTVRRFSTATENVVEAETVTPPPPPEPKVEILEKSVGSAVKHEFQAETRKLLDIVARSLYTDREVFIRELISNASDALEKVRHAQLLGNQLETKDQPLEISLYTDAKEKKLIIQDSGIGMNKDEMIKNLGSIGHSGSLDFINNLKSKNVSNSDIIGQFGVGFYSSFMVANTVTVFSRSALPGSIGYCWVSDGSGSYEISEAEGVSVGTKIVLDLNAKSEEFAQKEAVERIIKKYSNFVGFPIKLNSQTINTVKPLWTMSKKDISEQEHKEFYQFIAHAYDDPMLHLHYTTDSPLNIRAIFYVGTQHNEKHGMGRMEPGVNLFSKKVLIQARAKGLLPDFLRFIKGVVDSEDIPLNLSREHLQDSALIRRISNVLTKRILKWLDEESKKNPEKYSEFWEEFGSFLREGICTDFAFKEDIAKLLRYESSGQPSGQLSSLDEYVSKMDKDQKEIFYLCVPNRSIAETSPYYEAFKAKKKEVLFLYNQLDDFVMTNLGEYDKKKLVSVESAKAKESLKEDKKEEETGEKLSQEEVKEFAKWMKDTLSGRVSSITESDRLVDSPAIIVDHESASMRRMMKYVDPQRMPELPKQQLEINPKHPVIRGLNVLRTENSDLAKLVAEQIYDNALVAAGLLDDPRTMVPRLNNLLLSAINRETKHEQPKSQEKPKSNEATV
jgi:TNF receptor-associated protein 1